MRRECEGGGEEGDVVSVGAGAETGVEDVVGAGHAFYYVAGEVGVGAVGGDVDGGAGGEGEEIHCAGFGGGVSGGFWRAGVKIVGGGEGLH